MYTTYTTYIHRNQNELLRWPIIIIGALASVGLILVSVGVNYRFGASFGQSDFDSILYGSAAGLADILKAACPLLIAWATRDRNFAAAGAGLSIWLVCIILSISSGIGFSALNRAGATGAHTLSNLQYEQLRAEQKRLRERLGWHPRHRPSAVVETDLAAARQNWRWRSTRGCKNATVPPSIAFCDRHRGLITERAIAQDAAKLDQRLTGIRTKLEGINPAAISSGAHPQIATLSQLLDQPAETVQTGLIILLALVVEIGSSLGLFVVFSAVRKAPTGSANNNSNGRLNLQLQGSKPKLVYSAHTKVHSESDEQSAVRTFLNVQTEPSKGSAIGATELFTRYMGDRQTHCWPEISQRRFGLIMRELGYDRKSRCKRTGRTQYEGLARRSSETQQRAA